jgi:hypothetical protein
MLIASSVVACHARASGRSSHGDTFGWQCTIRVSTRRRSLGKAKLDTNRQHSLVSHQ